MGYERILVALEDSKTSLKVFKRGIKLAKLFHSEITLIGVVDTTAVTNYPASMDESGALLTSTELELLKGNENALREFMGKLISSERELTINEEVRYGTPHREISVYAKEWGADLLVVGNHVKDGSLSEFLFGSTAKKLLKEAPCDILIVKIEE